MINYKNLFSYFRQCPYLSSLMSIAGEAEQGMKIILPRGSGERIRHSEKVDALGNYTNTITPYPSTYEDFQINCYEWYDVNDTSPPQLNVNTLTYEDVCGVCQWIEEQNAINNFPDVGEKIVSIECLPFVPQIQYIDANTNTVGYYISVRIRYVNDIQGKYIEYEK